MDLRPGDVLVHEGRSLAFGAEGKGHPAFGDWSAPPSYLAQVEFTGEVIRFRRPWHLFQFNVEKRSRTISNCSPKAEVRSALSAHNTVIGDPELIFLEEGAVVEASILNTNNGPIYIGKGCRGDGRLHAARPCGGGRSYSIEDGSKGLWPVRLRSGDAGLAVK
jgi:hypothetical protein